MMQYAVVLTHTLSGWSARVPDLPGCTAEADSREEVKHLITEAIELHVENLEEHGDPVPVPTFVSGFMIGRPGDAYGTE